MIDDTYIHNIHLYYAPCLTCWALFGSLVPAMCNRTSCAQVHELPRSHCGDNLEGTLFSWLYIYNAHLASVRFEHSVCDGSLMTIYICIYVCIYVYICMYTCIYMHLYVYMYPTQPNYPPKNPANSHLLHPTHLQTVPI